MVDQVSFSTKMTPFLFVLMTLCLSCIILFYNNVYTYFLQYYYKQKIIQIPKHVAFIADGNGRWAKSRGQPRQYGHYIGSKGFDDIIRTALELEIKVLTFYVFSTENWKRPREEVDYIFDILSSKLSTINKRSEDQDNIFQQSNVYFVGSRSRLPPDLIAKMISLEELNKTKRNTKLSIVFAIDYGGQEEIAMAVRKMLSANSGMKIEDITPLKLSKYMELNQKIWPDPDLIIRTSGECRLSNFMIWHLSYAELKFMNVLWPDFRSIHLLEALTWYNTRIRRFGGLQT
jgi:undecaprenyl diphosphate synthase